MRAYFGNIDRFERGVVPVVPTPPAPITSFDATDNQPNKITCTWTNSTGLPTPTQELFRNGVSVASNVTSPYVYSITGPDTADYHVVATNTEGVEIGNVDSGTAVVTAALLNVTWDSLSADANINIIGTMEYTNDGGASWSNVTGGSLTLTAGVGPYELKETIALGAVTTISFFDVTSTKFDGNMIVTGGLNLNNMTSMFSSATELLSLDVSNLSTSNVTNMTNMFTGCSKITSLDTSNFDTSNVTNMNSMFNSCRKMTSFDLSNFNTSNVTSMDAMFAGIPDLTNINLSSFNTSKVTNMSQMFLACTYLPYLDLSSFDTSNVTDTFEMFNMCGSLKCITNIDTTTSTNKTDMFLNTTLMTQPDATAQADIQDANGANWVNANPCP